MLFPVYVLSLESDIFAELVGIPKQNCMTLISEIVEYAEQKETTGRPHKFSYEHEALLYLLYLRHFNTDIYTAAVWQCSKQTVYNTRKRMQKCFYGLLAPRISMLSLQERIKYSVKFSTQFIRTALMEQVKLQVLQKTHG